MALKTVFLGYGEIAVACLRAILGDPAVRNATVFLHAATRESGVRANEELAALAAPHGRPAELTDDTAELRDRVEEAGPDLLISVGWLKKVPGGILSIPRLGSVNLHGALLPKYRGRAPLCRALMNGESAVGVTVHYMTEEIDAGDIILQYRIRVTPQDDAASLFEKVGRISPDLLLRAVRMFEDGAPEGVPQDETLASRYGKLTPDECLIDWSGPAEAIHNMIRALVRPYPGAFTFYRGRKHFVWKSELVDAEGEDRGFGPGLIMANDRGGALIQTGRGLIFIGEVEPEGEQPGPPEWSAGEILSSPSGGGHDR
jgi:methionyl-tRNA formyltransferase